jgi:hypothetical protein
MPVAFVILALFGVRSSGYSRPHWRAPRTTGRSFFESMRNDELGVPVSIGDISKWNSPDVSGSGRVRAGWAAAIARRVWVVLPRPRARRAALARGR